MSGIKTFDPDEALERATRLFRNRGYEAVSILELEEATGLNRSSLYNAFGSKEELYARVLERYGTQVLDKVLPALSRADIAEAVEAFLRTYVAVLAEDPSRGGCLVFLSLHDRGITKDPPGRVLARHISRIRDAIEGRLALALERRELHDRQDATELASLLFGTMAGLATFTRLKAEASRSDALIGAVVRIAVTLSAHGKAKLSPHR